MKVTIAILFANLLILPSAFAEDISAGQAAKIEANKAKINAEMSKRFTKSDADQDGSLTLDEAKKGMPRVAKNFSKIDSAGAGKVTLEQIQSYMTAHLDAKKAAKQ